MQPSLSMQHLFFIVNKKTDIANIDINLTRLVSVSAREREKLLLS